MRLVVTGGGTGGHVFPALEVGLEARRRGWDVDYLGSNRGIEGPQCERAGIPFEGFPAEPVFRLASARGIRSALRMLVAAGRARRRLEEIRPDSVFSCGGYASAPVVHAARKLGLRYTLHEQNTVPGRTNRLLAPGASAVCTVFDSSARYFPGSRVVRTGMPVRAVLRASAQGTLPTGHSLANAAPIVLVMGGSQGSAALNDVALATAVRMSRTEVHWLHLTGVSHYDSTFETLRKMAIRTEYTIKAYLDEDEMAAALFSSAVAVSRSGAGTLAELAAFRKPSILVPYPHAFADHQRANALEFAAMGAAEVLPQADLVAASLEARIHAWLNDPVRSREAAAALSRWDVPDSADQILGIVAEGSREGAFVA